MEKKIFIILFLFMISAFFAFADKKGEEIAKKNFDLKKSDDMTGNTKMILIDKDGNKQVRIIKMFTKKGAYGTNSFAEFIEPADVKGTKFLTIVEKNGENVQRLYLPALKKVRRIASDNKDGKFMGSDLYYFDMEDHKFEDFTYEFVSENETLNVKDYAGMKFYIIKAYPVDKNAPYAYIKKWISMDNYLAYQSIPHDKKGNPEKIVIIFNVENIQGVLVPKKTLVINQKEKHQTLMTIEDIKINTGLKDNIFEVQNLN
jgi:outer membrane lipoprotein-sorting protein